MALAGGLTACISSPVLAEYRDVLFREKFAALHERAIAMLTDLEEKAMHVEATGTIQASSDEDDNRFLECAAAAQAEYLITGNLRHYPDSWDATRIVNARGFFDLTSGQ
jgi:uncharacterized protein